MGAVGRVLARTALLVLLLPALCRQARAAEADGHLFVIERSLNANAVAYDVVTTRSGALDPGSPLRVYWLMRAERGEVRELNALERSWAYGYDVRSCGERGCTVALHALRTRTVEIEVAGGAPRAVTLIGERRGVLRRVFVTAAGRGPVSSVTSVELFGESSDGRVPLYERIAGR